MHPPADPILCRSGSVKIVQSVRQTASIMPRELGTFVESAFLGGESLRRLWLAFGYYMNPITILSSAFTSLVLYLTSSVTVAVAAMFVISLCKSSVRLIVLGKINRGAALMILSRLFPIAALFTYVAILNVAIALSDEILAIQGRYWVPFLPVVWYSAIVIAPRAAPLQTERQVRRILILATACLMVAANLGAFPAIYQRYYAQPETAPDATELYAAFVIGSRSAIDVDLGSRQKNQRVHVEGVSVDLRSAAPMEALRLSVDFGKTMIPVHTILNAHFACANVLSSLANAGFAVDIDTASMSTGDHVAVLEARPRWSKTFLDSAAHLEMRVRQ